MSHDQAYSSGAVADGRTAPILTLEQEKDLIRRWKTDGDRQALDQLITSHMRLVPKIARRFSGYGIAVSELVSEGYVGLMQSAEKFAPEKGFRFSTYARWWIKAAILNFILQTWTMIKVGNSAGKKKLFFNLRRAKREMELEGDRYLTDADVTTLAERFHVSEDDVKAMDQRLSATDMSLDMPIGNSTDGSPLSILDTLKSDTPSPEDIVAEEEHESWRRRLLHNALGKLDKRERDIVTQRYLSQDPPTLSTLAHLYGVTAERVRQIEVAAIAKLKEAVHPEERGLAFGSI